jgi:hypothetical protein
MLKDKVFFFCSQPDIGQTAKAGIGQKGWIGRMGERFSHSRESGNPGFSEVIADLVDSRFRGND